MKEIIMVGIPGSGKTTFIKSHFNGFNIICPDDIRRELTGNISDQSKNKEVWDLAFERLRDISNKGKDVVFDATNLSINTIESIIREAKDNLTEIEFCIMQDSEEWHDCLERVRRQLLKGEVRSDVDVMVDDPFNKGKKINLVKLMYKKYKGFLKNNFNELVDTLKKEHTVSINYIKDGNII